MGEYAEDALDLEMECWTPRSNYRKRRHYEPPSCNRCGKEDLDWGETDAGYRLYEDGEPHECDEDDLHAEYEDDFEDIS